MQICHDIAVKMNTVDLFSPRSKFYCIVFLSAWKFKVMEHAVLIDHQLKEICKSHQFPKWNADNQIKGAHKIIDGDTLNQYAY